MAILVVLMFYFDFARDFKLSNAQR